MKGLGLDPWPLDTLAKYSADQPRLPAGQAGGGQWVGEATEDNNTADSQSVASEQTEAIVVGNKDSCIEECYFWLEMPEPARQFGTRQWDFHRCVAECMARG